MPTLSPFLLRASYLWPSFSQTNKQIQYTYSVYYLARPHLLCFICFTILTTTAQNMSYAIYKELYPIYGLINKNENEEALKSPLYHRLIIWCYTF